jgi:hypothetical protein
MSLLLHFVLLSTSDRLEDPVEEYTQRCTEELYGQQRPPYLVAVLAERDAKNLGESNTPTVSQCTDGQRPRFANLHYV